MKMENIGRKKKNEPPRKTFSFSGGNFSFFLFKIFSILLKIYKC